MANNAEELPEGQEKPKKSKKWIIVLFGLIFLIGGLVGGGYYFLTQNPEMVDKLFPREEPAPATTTVVDPVTGETTEVVVSPDAAPAATNGGPPTTTAAVQPTHLVELPPLMINLADTGTSRYLNIGIDIEVSSEEAAKLVEHHVARIRDAIIILLSGKTYQSLSTANGKFQVKNEIASRINQILNGPRVMQVYFTDFVVK